MNGERKSLVQLFVPISLELLCFMLAGMVDTMMLSAVNNDAVGAVGTANTYIGMFIKLMAVGAFIGMAWDECARAVCMVLRWRTGRWKNMKLIGE